MKKINFLLITCFFAFTVNAQDADSENIAEHFSLEGALELFKKSSDLEEFEKLLNQEDQNVNNLDLNEDGETDYIRVEDHMEGDVHAIVLQVPISEKESQDIAVIEIEKDGDESALLQIVGDEDIYGPGIYVEPFDEVASSDGRGPNAEYHFARIVVNVWAWPSVRYVYRPGYRVYVSPWRWHYYPTWYRPWRPRPIRTFVSLTSPFKVKYRVVPTHRVVRAHKVYVPRKTTSVTVKTRVTKTRGKTTVAKSATVSKRSATGTKTNTTTAASRKSTQTRTGAGQTKTTTKAAKKTKTTTKTTAGKKTKTKTTKAKKTKTRKKKTG